MSTEKIPTVASTIRERRDFTRDPRWASMPWWNFCAVHHVDWHFLTYSGGSYGADFCKALEPGDVIACQWDEPCSREAAVSVPYLGWLR